MADETTKTADVAATPDTSAPAPAPTPDPTPAKPAKASKAAAPDPEPEKPATVTVINTSGLKFRLGWAGEDELSLLLPGENKGVDSDLFDAWAKQHADSDLVKNGVITKK